MCVSFPEAVSTLVWKMGQPCPPTPHSAKADSLQQAELITVNGPNDPKVVMPAAPPLACPLLGTEQWLSRWPLPSTASSLGENTLHVTQ